MARSRQRSIEEDMRRFEEISRHYLASRTQPTIDAFFRAIFGRRNG